METASIDRAPVADRPRRAICWIPLWNEARPAIGLEHLLLAEQAADSVVLAYDDAIGPFRLEYRLAWDERWRLREGRLTLVTSEVTRALSIHADGRGRWQHADGRAIPELDGCIDIDIWPTPFTNRFPIRRDPIEIGERREFRVAWVDGTALSLRRQRQAYTRIAERAYLFEQMDGDFRARLTVDAEGIVVDYPGLFRRVPEIEQSAIADRGAAP